MPMQMVDSLAWRVRVPVQSWSQLMQFMRQSSVAFGLLHAISTCTQSSDPEVDWFTSVFA